MPESETPLNIFYNPNPNSDVLPPPWYRPPPGVTEGPPRTLLYIVGGLLINNDEGHDWFKRTYNIALADHHREDINVIMRLGKLVREQGLAYGCCFAPRRLESLIDDVLVITHIQYGPFVHNGPECYEEVYDEERKPVPGVKEEEVKAKLKKEFGIETSGYKSYYTNMDYESMFDPALPPFEFE